MKAELLVENLEKPLSLITKILPSFSQVPVLSNILIEATKDGFFLSATDLEIGVRIKIPAKIEEMGATTIPGKLFIETVSSLPKDKLKIEQEKDTVHLYSRSNKISMQTIAKEEFPNILENKGEKIAEFSENELKNIFTKLLFAVSNDDTRAVLTGVLVAQKNGKVDFVATDGFRLSYETIKKEILKEEEKMIISGRLIEETLSLKPEKEDKIQMYLYKEGNQVIFETKDTLLVGRTIEGEFPKYEKVIPSQEATKTSIDKDELLQSTRLSMVFAKENANIIKLKIKDGTLYLLTKSTGVGEGEVKVDVEQKGDDNEIAFNAKFLLDYLRSTNSKKIEMVINSDLEPGLFKQEGDDSYIHIIMPVRIQD